MKKKYEFGRARAETIAFKVTKEEKEKIVNHALKGGESSYSSWLRRLALSEANKGGVE